MKRIFNCTIFAFCAALAALAPARDTFGLPLHRGCFQGSAQDDYFAVLMGDSSLVANTAVRLKVKSLGGNEYSIKEATDFHADSSYQKASISYSVSRSGGRTSYVGKGKAFSLTVRESCRKPKFTLVQEADGTISYTHVVRCTQPINFQLLTYTSTGKLQKAQGQCGDL